MWEFYGNQIKWSTNLIRTEKNDNILIVENKISYKYDYYDFLCNFEKKPNFVYINELICEHKSINWHSHFAIKTINSKLTLQFPV